MKTKPKPIVKIVVINNKSIGKFKNMLEKEALHFFKVEVDSVRDLSEINLANTDILVIFYSKKLEQQLKNYMSMLNSSIQQISILDEKKNIQDVEQYSKFSNVVFKQTKLDDRSFAFSIIYDFYKKYMQ